MPAPRGSRFSRWRAASLVAVHVAIGLHIVHWKLAGRTLAPLELNEVLYTLHAGILTVGFLFMAVAVLSVCVAGRFFCSWGCHLLALQDLSAWLLARVGIRPRPVPSRVLPWVPVLAMSYLFLGPQIERLLRGAVPPVLRVVSEPAGWTSLTTTDLWRNLPGPWVAALTLAVCGFATVWFLGSRGFCRSVCPYGAIFAGADRLAPGRIVAAGDCSRCGLCTAVCQSQVRVQEEVARFGAVLDPACLRDLDCVGVCPDGALRFGFTRPPLLRGARSQVGGRRARLTRGEEALLAATLAAGVLVFRGLYDAVPLLLAIAIGVLLGAIAVLALRLARGRSVLLAGFPLTASGRSTPAGRVFALVAGLLALLLAHSAGVQAHAFLGERALRELAALRAGVAASAPLAPTARAAAERALAHLEWAHRFGLVRPEGPTRRLVALRRGLARLGVSAASRAASAEPGRAGGGAPSAPRPGRSR